MYSGMNDRPGVTTPTHPSDARMGDIHNLVQHDDNGFIELAI
jgi:hypothetical protein